MAASVAVSTPVDLVVGQHATLQGHASGNLTTPLWQYQSGEGAAFVLQAGAELKIGRVIVASISGLAFRIYAGATLTSSALQLQTAAGAAALVSCAALASGIGGTNMAGPLTGCPGSLRRLC